MWEGCGCVERRCARDLPRDACLIALLLLLFWRLISFQTPVVVSCAPRGASIGRLGKTWLARTLHSTPCSSFGTATTKLQASCTGMILRSIRFLSLFLGSVHMSPRFSDSPVPYRFPPSSSPSIFRLLFLSSYLDVHNYPPYAYSRSHFLLSHYFFWMTP
jgi:hypothetical protein